VRAHQQPHRRRGGLEARARAPRPRRAAPTAGRHELLAQREQRLVRALDLARSARSAPPAGTRRRAWPWVALRRPATIRRARTPARARSALRVPGPRGGRATRAKDRRRFSPRNTGGSCSRIGMKARGSLQDARWAEHHRARTRRGQAAAETAPGRGGAEGLPQHHHGAREARAACREPVVVAAGRQRSGVQLHLVGASGLEHLVERDRDPAARHVVDREADDRGGGKDETDSRQPARGAGWESSRTGTTPAPGGLPQHPPA
jgi:hypothetical protein